MSELTSWELRRSRFNHDWLGNHFLNTFDAFLQRLEGGGEDVASLERFIRHDFAQWPGKEAEVGELLNAFMQEMSPRALLAKEPLVRLDPGTRTWLGSVVDELWRARHSVTVALSSARGKLEAASQQYRAISKELDEDPIDAETLRRLLSHFRKFECCCRLLKDAMSEFPREVLVV